MVVFFGPRVFKIVAAAHAFKFCHDLSVCLFVGPLAWIPAGVYPREGGGGNDRLVICRFGADEEEAVPKANTVEWDLCVHI